MQLKQHKRRQVQRQTLLTKKVKLKLQPVLRLQKKPKLPLNKHQVQQLKDKSPIKQRKLHQINKEHKQNQISQPMIQQLIVNFKTNRQRITNVIKGS